MDGFWGNIFNLRHASRDTRRLLRNTPIFSDLSGRELSLIERILYTRSYREGEVVFQARDPGITMYIVQEGCVDIIHEASQRILASLKEGEFFGEIALLNETPRSATALVKAPTILLGVSQPDLLDLFHRNTRLGVKVLIPLSQISGKRLVHISDEATELHKEIERLRSLLPGELELTHESPEYTLD
jgi:CRP-like cAMP-binding protein